MNPTGFQGLRYQNTIDTNRLDRKYFIAKAHTPKPLKAIKTAIMPVMIDTPISTAESSLNLSDCINTALWTMLNALNKISRLITRVSTTN
jgi:hypothetical protein